MILDRVPLEVRRFRVEHQASRRKRDLAAVRLHSELQARERLADVSAPTPLAELAFLTVRFHLRAAVSENTYGQWLAPLRVAGASGSTLYLSAPETIRVWVERRYSGLIREALGAVGAPWSEVGFVGEPI